MPRTTGGTGETFGAGEIDARLDALFAGDPEQFTAARDVLARELRSRGHAAEAARVKHLRRPTVAAWGLNQAARRCPADVDAYLEASASLRAAQERGNHGPSLRGAIERHRALQRRLVDAGVEAIVQRGGNADASRAELQQTVEAAALDAAVADAVRRGRLSSTANPQSAFDVLDVTAPARRAAPKPASPPATRPPSDRGRVEAAPRQEQHARALANFERAEATARAADDAARRAHRELVEAEAALERARRGAARAEAALAKAREAEQSARARLRSAP